MDWFTLQTLAQAAQRDVWRLNGSITLWSAGIAAVGLVFFAAVVYLLEPKVRRGGAKLLLFLLRGAVLLGCLGLLLNPTEFRETVEMRDAYTVILLDKSVSMSLNDRYDNEEFLSKLAEVTGKDLGVMAFTPRLERVRAALTNSKLNFIRKLRERNKVKIYSFDAERSTLVELGQTDPEAAAKEKGDGGEDASLIAESDAFSLLDKLKADGAATAIGDALNKIQKDLRSEKISAIILITDGRQNAGSLDPFEEALRFRRRRIPIHTVGVGDPREAKDLKVDNLQAPDVSIVGDLISYDCVIKSTGFKEAIEVDVELLFDGVVRERQRVQVGGDQPERAVRMRTKPDVPGEYATEIRINVLPVEINPKNNVAKHALRVIDQRIKVLYIDGYPRWEYRYLKNALVRDRSMEVQCLLLSAESGFPQEATPGLASLRRIPDRKELLGYHVVILGDINPEATWPDDGTPVFPDAFWNDLTEFVGDFGGGLLLMSGQRDCPRRFSGRPLAKLLPVVIDKLDRSQVRYTEVFYPQLTRIGKKSSLMRIDPNERRNQALWDNEDGGLPGFYWYERAVKSKPLARVLAVHPDKGNENGKYPIFAWQYYKSGTVFFSAIDSTWRWRAGVGDKYTYRFYGQIIRFLSNGRFQRSKRFSITTDKIKYTLGEEVHVTARVYNREMKPSSEKERQAEIETPDGRRDKLTLALIQDKPGHYEAFYRASARGKYRAILMAPDAGADEEAGPRPFEVVLPSAELAETRMNAKGLKKIADVSGGSYVRLTEIGELPEQIKSMRERIPLAASERKLWDNHWVFLILISLLILEWVGRKVIKLL